MFISEMLPMHALIKWISFLEQSTLNEKKSEALELWTGS